MKFLTIFVLLTAQVWAQGGPRKTPAAGSEVSDDTLIAILPDGKKLTAGDLRAVIQALPQQMQENALRDRKLFVQQYALMRSLSQMAEKNKLDQKSPTRESLEFNRIYVLMNAQLNDRMNQIMVEEPELKAFYEKNRDRYSQVKLKVIYVSFTANPQAASPTGKKYLSEAEALAKIEKIAAQVKGGADFVNLVKEHSEDPTSAGKDGDFGVIRRSDNIPDAIRAAVFALKQGELSAPVRQPNGFYLFRADEVSSRSFDQVKFEILDEIKQARFKQWMDEMNRSMLVKFENEAALTTAPAAPAVR